MRHHLYLLVSFPCTSLLSIKRIVSKVSVVLAIFALPVPLCIGMTTVPLRSEVDIMSTYFVRGAFPDRYPSEAAGTDGLDGTVHAGQEGSAVQHRCTEAVEVGKEKSFCCFFDAKSCPSLKYVGCYFHQYEILFALHHFCELIHLHFLPFYHVITHRLVSSHVNHAVHWPWAPR